MEEEHGCRALSLVKVQIRFWRVFAFGHLHAKQSLDAAPRRAPRANCRPTAVRRQRLCFAAAGQLDDIACRGGRF